jgi:hypothetical protein
MTIERATATRPAGWLAFVGLAKRVTPVARLATPTAQNIELVSKGATQ